MVSDNNSIVLGIKHDLKFGYLESLISDSKVFDINLIRNEFLTYFLDLSEERDEVIRRHFEFGSGDLRKIYSIAGFLDLDIENLPPYIIMNYLRNGKVEIGDEVTVTSLYNLSPEEILMRRGL